MTIEYLLTVDDDDITIAQDTVLAIKETKNASAEP